MIGGPFFITPHAVRRYMLRINGGIDYEHALEQLIDHTRTARRVKMLDTGAQLWRTGKPLRLRLIVDCNQPGKPQLVTVL